MKLRIRRFGLADLDRLMEIERASFPKAPYSRDLFCDLHAACGRFFFIALIGRSLAGYCVACPRPPRAELVSIAVGRRWRRHGIAEALLRYTMARLARIPVSTLSLTVRIGNRGAIALYRNFGFGRTRRIPRYYENGEDGLRMLLRLKPAVGRPPG